LISPQTTNSTVATGRTYLTMRLVFQILGYEMVWKQDNPDIQISKDDEKKYMRVSSFIGKYKIDVFK